MNGHLTEDLIQAYLDGRASLGEAREVAAHVSSCPACRVDLETWGVLFGDLRDLPRLEPSPALRPRILDHVSIVRPLASPAARPADLAHPAADELVDYVDHVLPDAVAASVQTHLAECAPCAAEVTQFRQVFASLDGLGRMSPPAHFADRVMRHVQVSPPPSVASPAVRLGRRALAIAQRLRPTRGRRWAVLAGVGTAPAVVLTVIASVVLSHPLVTFSGMASYAWWKVTQLASIAAAPVVSGMVQSAGLFRAYSVVGFLTESPLVTATGVLVFFALTAGAAWFLYRNVFVARSTGRKYATARV